MTDKLLKLALGIGVFNGLFWQLLPKGSYYILNGLFLTLLCLVLFLEDRQSKIKFILVSLSISNLFDELFFDPTKLQLNEIVLLIIIVCYARKIPKH